MYEPLMNIPSKLWASIGWDQLPGRAAHWSDRKNVVLGRDMMVFAWDCWGPSFILSCFICNIVIPLHFGVFPKFQIFRIGCKTLRAKKNVPKRFQVCFLSSFRSCLASFRLTVKYTSQKGNANQVKRRRRHCLLQKSPSGKLLLVCRVKTSTAYSRRSVPCKWLLAEMGPVTQCKIWDGLVFPWLPILLPNCTCCSYRYLWIMRFSPVMSRMHEGWPSLMNHLQFVVIWTLSALAHAKKIRSTRSGSLDRRSWIEKHNGS